MSSSNILICCLKKKPEYKFIFVSSFYNKNPFGPYNDCLIPLVNCETILFDKRVDIRRVVEINSESYGLSCIHVIEKSLFENPALLFLGELEGFDCIVVDYFESNWVKASPLIDFTTGGGVWKASHLFSMHDLSREKLASKLLVHRRFNEWDIGYLFEGIEYCDSYLLVKAFSTASIDALNFEFEAAFGLLSEYRRRLVPKNSFFYLINGQKKHLVYWRFKGRLSDAVYYFGDQGSSDVECPQFGIRIFNFHEVYKYFRIERIRENLFQLPEGLIDQPSRRVTWGSGFWRLWNDKLLSKEDSFLIERSNFHCSLFAGYVRTGKSPNQNLYSSASMYISEKLKYSERKFKNLFFPPDGVRH